MLVYQRVAKMVTCDIIRQTDGSEQQTMVTVRYAEVYGDCSEIGRMFSKISSSKVEDYSLNNCNYCSIKKLLYYRLAISIYWFLVPFFENIPSWHKNRWLFSQQGSEKSWMEPRCSQGGENRGKLQGGAPKIAFSWFISGSTMVYGRYNYI